MNKHLQHLLLFETCRFQTKLPGREIVKRIESFLDPFHTNYYGSTWEDGFYIAEKNRQTSMGVRTQNSFAPVVTGKITEQDGITTVSMVFRMNILAMILFIPFYVASLITVIMFPLMLLLLYFAFVKPVERLKDTISSLLVERGRYE